MMTGSRRFLLVLVLACITCVVLVQRSMDDVTQTQYSRNEDTGSHNLLDVSTNPTTATKTTTTMVKASSSARISNKTIKFVEPISVFKSIKSQNLVPITEHKSVGNTPKKTNKSAAPKAEIRRIPLAKNQQLISRQDRIQEILKQGTSVKQRPTINPMRSIKSMPIADPNTVQRVFIVTYFRAGSSFFGDILQQNWRTFYHFEPLHSMTYDKRINDTKVPEVFSLFDNILHCNFSQAVDYLEWVKKARNQFLFAHNLFLWVTCHGNAKTCFDPAFVNAACIRAPVHVMKVTRLHMRHVQSYIETNPDMNLKVVYLTRDPRGIVSSRWSLDWCNGTNCSDSGVLCHEMDEDLAIFNDLKRRQPSNFVKLRYEDLALNPELETQKLFDFLQLPFSASVKKFLKTHTVSSRKADDRNPYSTRRNSSSMVLSWVERFTYKQVVEVQAQCENVLNKLNHSLIMSPSQLPYPTGKPKMKPSPPSGREWRFNKNPIAKKYLSGQKDTNQSIPSYSDNSLDILNNTNIEIHKSYKVVDGYTGHV